MAELLQDPLQLHPRCSASPKSHLILTACTRRRQYMASSMRSAGCSVDPIQMFKLSFHEV
jgi:hypothetical protein